MIERLAPWLASVAFVFFGCFVLWLLSVIGDWRKLARHYATSSPAEGEIHRMQSAAVGDVNYASCLTIVLSPYGLRLAVWPMFRIGHPPLLVPWSEFRDVREVRWLFSTLDEVTVGDPTIATVRFRPHILRAARKLGYLAESGWKA